MLLKVIYLFEDERQIKNQNLILKKLIGIKVFVLILFVNYRI